MNEREANEIPKGPRWLQPSWIFGVIALGCLYGFMAWSRLHIS